MPAIRAAIVVTVVGAAVLEAQPPRMVDMRAEAGVDFVQRTADIEKRTILSSLGGGAALIDYDSDSDLDLYLVSEGANRLYRNEGSWRFVDVTSEAGAGDEGRGVGCAVGDFDNDGLADLYVINIGPSVLYRNRGDGTFDDVTVEIGAVNEGFGASAAFFDADGDGDLDLYVANYVDPDQRFPEPGSEPTCRWLSMAVMCGPRGLEGDQDLFFRNDGTRFVESSRESGLFDAGRAFGLGVVSADYDADGDADLYVANDTDPNLLFRNDGPGRFEEVGLLAGAAYDGSGAAKAGMGVDIGDPNRDGHLDIFVTNFSHETNTLFLGSESGLFTDATEESGLAQPSLGKLGWGTRFADLDNDGDEDLFVANGHVYPDVSKVDATTSYRQRNQIFVNDGTGSFSELRIESDSAEGPKSYRGAAVGDLDGDGDPDLVVTAIDDRPAILRNDMAQGNHWLGLRLVGRRSNRDAAGARVELESAGLSQTKVAHASGSVFSSSDARVLFGLGASATAEEIRVHWPSGDVTRLRAVSADRHVVMIEGIGAEN